MNNIKITRIKELLVCLLIAFGFARLAVGQEGTSNLLTTNSPFVRYLQNPPWIKEMRYVQSVNCGAASEPGEIEKHIWLDDTNRFGLQPNGMFYERLTANPFGPPRLPGEKIVIGSYKHYDWIGDLNRTSGGLPTLSLSSKYPQEGASTNNHSTSFVAELAEIIGWVRFFELPPLQTNSFTLLNNNTFVAKTAAGYELNGNIIAASNDNPLSLTYTIGGGDTLHSVTYKYKPGQSLPYYFETRSTFKRKVLGDPVTNWIERADYGMDQAATNGYTPAMFFTNLDAFTHLLVESNGQRYAITQNGKRKAIDKTPFHPLPLDQRRNNRFLFIIMLLFLVAAGIFIWRSKRGC